LPAPARYALALGILVLVVGLVFAVTSTDAAPADWYSVIVTVGAVVLLVWIGGRLLLRLVSVVNRHRGKSRGA
jgi:hypothetical protein